jgi:hypothetical protein
VKGWTLDPRRWTLDRWITNPGGPGLGFWNDHGHREAGGLQAARLTERMVCLPRVDVATVFASSVPASSRSIHSGIGLQRYVSNVVLTDRLEPVDELADPLGRLDASRPNDAPLDS